MNDVFKTTTNKKITHWFIGDKICDNCKKSSMYHTAFLIYDWNPKKFTRQLLCGNCLNKILPVAYAQDRIQVYCVEKIPIGAIPVFINPPNLKPIKGDVSIFEHKKVLSEKTSDKTIVPSFFGEGKAHGFTIGITDKKYIDSIDHELSTNEGIKFLEEIK